MAAGTFTPATFSFLRELRKNNDREWFATNKQRYECDGDASVRFIAEFAPAAGEDRPAARGRRPSCGWVDVPHLPRYPFLPRQDALQDPRRRSLLPREREEGAE